MESTGRSSVPSKPQAGRVTWAATRSAASSLAACFLLTIALLLWLGGRYAGPDAGDLLGFIVLYAAAVSVPATIGVFYAALVARGLRAMWGGVIGPVSAGIGFLLKGVVQQAADGAGLPRPSVSEFLVGAVIAAVGAIVLYLVVWWFAARRVPRLAA